MIVEYIRYSLVRHEGDNHEERFAAFEAAYRQAAEQLRASSDCLGFELTRCVEEPHRYVLRIEWQSVEAHVMGFRRSPLFKPFLEAIKGFIPEIEEMHHYVDAGIASRRPA
jgi:quinol monooxygenase YgiN